MACAIRGMADAEIVALTGAMVRSGDVLSYGGDRIVVDKHSSGGVGDTVSLIAVPLVAACGVPVAKLSGRALGHTGGTLDKLEAIPGVRTDLSPAAFVAQVEAIGCAVAAQSERLVPADRKLYALRDRTGTVASVGLIAASIVSKKIAGGAGAIVFDVKAGSGAFMRTVADATGLAQTLVRLAASFGKRASALVSDMEEPLGAAVGSGIEAVEARDFLRGDDRDPRLAEAVFAVAHEMLRVGGVAEDAIVPNALDALQSGAAYERFVQLVEAQGGTPRGGRAHRGAPAPRRRDRRPRRRRDPDRRRGDRRARPRADRRPTARSPASASWRASGRRSAPATRSRSARARRRTRAAWRAPSRSARARRRRASSWKRVVRDSDLTALVN